MAQVLKANERLRVNNDTLREEIEELKEMVEILRARGRSGSKEEPTELGEARSH